MNRRFGMTLAAVALAVVACGRASGHTAPPESAEVTIAIENFSFGEPVNLAPGDSVTVVNRDGVSHTWTSVDGVFDSGSIEPDGRFTFSFQEPGHYEFSCSIHPSMKGTLSVSG